MCSLSGQMARFVSVVSTTASIEALERFRSARVRNAGQNLAVGKTYFAQQYPLLIFTYEIGNVKCARRKGLDSEVFEA